MAVIKNVELWWVKCDAKNPVKNPDATKPDYWEIQVRTTDKAMALAWAKKNVKFKPLKRVVKDDAGEPILDDMGEIQRELVTDDAGKPYFSVNLRRKTKKANGEEMPPVKVLAGNLEDLDPRTIGNGSVANVGVFQYEYTYQGKEGVANMLKSIQVTKLMEYIPKSDDDGFEMVDMKVVKAADDGNSQTSKADFDDLDDEIPF